MTTQCTRNVKFNVVKINIIENLFSCTEYKEKNIKHRQQPDDFKIFSKYKLLLFGLNLASKHTLTK